MAKWTEKDIQFLRENYKTMIPDEIAKVLNRSSNSIKKRACRLDLQKKRRGLSKEEKVYILKNYATMGPEKLAEKIGATRNSVYMFAYKQGLKVLPEFKSKIISEKLMGHKHSEETKQKISVAHQFYTESNKCIECGKEIVRKATRCRTCNLKSRAGEGHMWWAGGITEFNTLVKRLLYPEWKFPILERDGFMCTQCGSSDNLEVHHLRMYKDIRDNVLQDTPELSFDGEYAEKLKLAMKIVEDHSLADGVTLCRTCHMKVHWEKQDELLETPNGVAEDNQQPSLSNVKKKVDRKVQRLTDEDSHPISPTRASCTT